MADRFEPSGPAEPGEDRPFLHQIAWFLGLSLAGLIVVATTAYILRGLLFMAT